MRPTLRSGHFEDERYVAVKDGARAIAMSRSRWVSIGEPETIAEVEMALARWYVGALSVMDPRLPRPFA